MNKQKYIDPNYTPTKHICEELENLNEQKEDLSQFNLKNANLVNINLINAKMKNANLERADLLSASMYGINLSGSNLFKANFENANLNGANLENCNLLGTNFTNTKLKNVNWGKNYKVINELEAEEAYKNKQYKIANKKYKEAEDVYRNIKISMQTQTLGNDTGEFFIREMITKRKQLNRYSAKRIGSKIIEITTGYGEKLQNIIFTILGIIITCMILYGIEGVKYNDPIYGERIIGFFSEDFEKFGLLNTIGNLFYFSVVVYSTVGFGEIVPIGILGKSIVIFEGIIGGLILAILIIALYKKSMDR